MMPMLNHAEAITPADSDLSAITCAISFINSGTQVLVVQTPSGETVNCGALPSGLYYIRAKRVTSASTVTSVVGWWT